MPQREDKKSNETKTKDGPSYFFLDYVNLTCQVNVIFLCLKKEGRTKELPSHGPDAQVLSHARGDALSR